MGFFSRATEVFRSVCFMEYVLDALNALGSTKLELA